MECSIKYIYGKSLKHHLKVELKKRASLRHYISCTIKTLGMLNTEYFISQCYPNMDVKLVVHNTSYRWIYISKLKDDLSMTKLFLVECVIDLIVMLQVWLSCCICVFPIQVSLHRQTSLVYRIRN